MKSKTLGILMLDSQFPRPLGDIGNKKTFPFPVKYKTIKGASPHLAVKKNAKGLASKFIKAAQTLEKQNVFAITTSCGFLILLQKQLTQKIKVPIITSALLQVPMIEKMLPKNKQIGILTISASSLSKQHLRAANIKPDIPIASLEDSHFATSILENKKTLDIKKAKQENIIAAKKLINNNKNIAAIVLECTNMIPYANAINIATGLPVFSLETLIKYTYGGLVPTKFI